MAQQKAFQRSIRLPAGLGDWTQLQPQRRDENSVVVSPLKGVYFDRLPEQKIKDALEIHYRFSEKFLTQFSAKLKIKIELHNVQCMQASYVDFLRECSHRVYQANFPARASGIHFYIDDVLASAMVNRALGGKGEAAPDAKLSGAERSVILQIAQQMGELLCQAWMGVLPALKTGPEQSYGSLQVDSTLSKEDTYVVFSMDIALGEETPRSMRWGYSQHLLGALLEEFERQRPARPRVLRLSEKVMHSTQVLVRLELGSTLLTAHELKKLQAGDVISLDASLAEPVKIKISDHLTLYGQAGVQDGKLGVQLLSATAIPFVYREQMGLSAKQALVVSDESIVLEAQKMQHESLDAIGDDDEEDQVLPQAALQPTASAEPTSEPVEPAAADDQDESAEETPQAPRSSASKAEADEDDLDDLFADEDFKWDEDADDDKEI